MYSDGSASGCDAHLDLNGEQACHKLWEVSEGEKSSTWRELLAIDYALKSFLPIIKGSHLKWFSDNQTAVRIVQVWTLKKELHGLAIKIFQCCAENQISLDIQLIPRSDLERADNKSRIVDMNDWQITSSCFEYIEKLWGPHTVDRFADYYTKSKHFSRNSGTLIPVEWTFFVRNVGNENCLVVPPVTMITKAIHYLYASRAIGTVIVPFWPSAYFWPVITKKFRDDVTDYEAFKGKWSLRHLMGTFWQSEWTLLRKKGVVPYPYVYEKKEK